MKSILFTIAWISAMASPARAAFVPKSIAAGSRHTCAVSTAGQVKCWGENSFGELGLGSTYAYGFYPASMGANLPAVNLGSGVTAQSVCAGDGFSCALTQKGQVKCWGSNGEGQLGQGRNIYSVGAGPDEMGDALPFTNLGTGFVAKALTCGVQHACAVSLDGRAKCWGSNDKGQLGIEQSVANVGTKDDMGDKLPYVVEQQKFVSIAGAAQATCALLENNTIKCWGDNFFGILGIEKDEQHGRTPNSMGAKLPIVKLDTGTYKIIDLQVGYAHACARYVKENEQKMKCWGYAGDGRLGSGIAPGTVGNQAGSMGAALPLTLVDATKVREARAYGPTSCVLFENGSAKCWGYNGEGQLGNGERTARGYPAASMGEQLPAALIDLPILTLSAGPYANHTCAILINHAVKCWGFGSSGQLGYENGLSIGANANDMNENLQFVNID